MDFALTDDQQLIRDSAESFLADVSDSAAVRVAMETASGFDEDVWKRIAGELGWCATMIPEACGGLGLGPVELTLLMEQMGRRLLCSPFFSTAVLATSLLNEIGTDAAHNRFLPGIADGSLRLTAPLFSDAGEVTAATAPFTARSGQEGWIIDGRCEAIPDAASSDWLLLPAKTAGGTQLSWFAVPRAAEGLRIEGLKTWDSTRRLASVECRSVAVTLEEWIDDPARLPAGLVRANALTRLALSAEQLGAAQQCLDMTVAYTAERKQFGRTIASFQAIKHRCAEMMVRIEGLRSAVYGAAALAGGKVDAGVLAVECAATKALSSDVLFWCAQEAIQLHGGVGFTWEYDPHLYFKRAQAGSHWLGTAEALREWVASSIIDEVAACN